MGPDPMICRICRRPLDAFSADAADPTSVQYLHPTVPGLDPGDHDPEPIPRDAGLSLVSACDFCSRPGASWVYPCGPFVSAHLLRPDTGYELELRSSDPWGACDPCHDDIQHDRWDDIVRRGAGSRPPSLSEDEYRRLVEHMHAQFRAHRNGEPYPVL
jgi:hypothetical protein